jgi:hypothetical protein
MFVVARESFGRFVARHDRGDVSPSLRFVLRPQVELALALLIREVHDAVRVRVLVDICVGLGRAAEQREDEQTADEGDTREESEGAGAGAQRTKP